MKNSSSWDKIWVGSTGVCPLLSAAANKWKKLWKLCTSSAKFWLTRFGEPANCPCWERATALHFPCSIFRSSPWIWTNDKRPDNVSGLASPKKVPLDCIKFYSNLFAKERSRDPFSPSAAREIGANSCHEVWHEDEAANKYADKFGRAIYPVGFVINPSLSHLGCSPHRRVYDPSENEPWGLLEIKCSPSDYLSGLMNLKHSGRTGAHILRKTHAYYYQTMGCIGLTSSTWEDFLSFARVSSTVKKFILILRFSQRCLKSSTTPILAYILMLPLNECILLWGFDERSMVLYCVKRTVHGWVCVYICTVICCIFIDWFWVAIFK